MLKLRKHFSCLVAKFIFPMPGIYLVGLFIALDLLQERERKKKQVQVQEHFLRKGQKAMGKIA